MSSNLVDSVGQNSIIVIKDKLTNMMISSL